MYRLIVLKLLFEIMQNEHDSYVPSLVFIETTKACDYSCRHCRAESQSISSPDELSTAEIKGVLKQIREISPSPPEIVITGGNFLLRPDIREIIEYTRNLGLKFSASPAGSPLLTEEFMKFLARNGARSISLSLDGTDHGSHDWLRRIPGSFDLTLNLILQAKKIGLKTQVNTTVFRRNIEELPYIAALLKDAGITTWEVFFLIKTGRGMTVEDVTPDEYMQINLWLHYLRGYGFNVRTVESPVFRVIGNIAERDASIGSGSLYRRLTEMTVSMLGVPVVETAKQKTWEARHSFHGTLFIGHNGEVHPSGLFNVPLGNIRENSLRDIIGRSVDFLDPRSSGRISGKCGRCEFLASCGGSRARSYASTGDPFAPDPACTYVPASLNEVALRQQ